MIAAVRRMIAEPPEGFGLSARGITVSTVGLVPQIRKLAHEDVPVTGEVYSCGGGHVARIFTGVTPGWTDTESLTVEDIRDHFDEIRDETGYAVPANLTEELMGTLKALGG